jgi:hypothetical protein
MSLQEMQHTVFLISLLLVIVFAPVGLVGLFGKHSVYGWLCFAAWVFFILFASFCPAEWFIHHDH